MPAVSVIVPNYNHARFLRQRIDSIVAQTFQDFELILLDDCSTDESRMIMQEYASYPDVRLKFSERNSGSPFKQWNTGVRLTRGKYVWIAESDDYADPHLLERAVSALDANSPQVVLVYCRSRCVDEEGDVTGFVDRYLFDLDPVRWASNFCVDGGELCREYFARLNPIPNASAVVFRKDAYEAVGGADESLRLCGDWKLWAALALQGKVAYICEALNYYRSHVDSLRNQTGRANRDAAEYLHVSRWVLERVSLSCAELEQIREARAMMWVPALLSFRTPSAVRAEIIRHIRDFDPHPVRRAVRPAFGTFRRKIVRCWRDFRAMARLHKHEHA
jgi:glycosyltransferase involved in cell wall biosynthesis